jgi:hypothetical protein
MIKFPILGRLLSVVVLGFMLVSCAGKSPVTALPPAGTPVPVPVTTPPAPAPKQPAAEPEPKPVAEIPAVPPPQVVRLPGLKTPAVEKTLAILEKLWALDRGESHAPVRFELSDQEVNEYLAYALTASRRPGIRAATLHFLPGNNVIIFIEVDFTAFNSWDSYRIPAFLSPALLGVRTVRVDARFDSADNKFRLGVNAAYGPQGTAIPSFVMEGIVQAIGLAQRETFNTGVNMSLPLGLKRVWTSAGVFGGET